MTLHIAICDDEDKIGFQIEEYVEKICAKMNIKPKITVYTDGESLCESLTDGVCFDLIFLDIELKNISGVQVGTKNSQ